MTRLRLCLLSCATLLLPLIARGSGVLINEIMYQPASLSTNEEWVELYNAGTNAVDLQGWAFTKGVNFTFTNAYTLNPGGYVVVCANKAAFAAKNPLVPLANVFGNWTGTLRNSGDTIRLVDAATNKVNEVTYADEGDWAFRRRGPLTSNHRGWEWYAPHKATDRSLELRNVNLPTSAGQNWAASTVDLGTPGAPNSVRATDTPPLILDVAHYPLVPASTNTITITAKIIDPQTNGTTVRLQYRLDAYPQSGSFAAVTMFDDGAHNDGIAGDGVFGALLPRQTNSTIIEFYVEAFTTTRQTNFWPGIVIPSFDNVGPTGHVANALLQVDNATYPSGQPVYRLLMTETERRERDTINNTSPDRSSDAAMNATLITVDGAGSELRYLCGIRERGAGSRGDNQGVPNQRVNVPSDRKWKGVTAFNLNSQFPHAQIAGYALAARSGLHTESARIVQVRINSTNNANAGLRQYGSYIHLEAPNADMVDAHFLTDAGGNLYRASSGSHSADLGYRGTNYLSYVSAGYAKQNNGSENDWTDLIHLTDVLTNTPDASYVAAVRSVANVEEWMLYFAAFSLTDSEETSLATGQGDDYTLYRGSLDPRFQLLAHDWDTILGQGQGSFATNRSLFRMASLPAVARFIRHPDFVPSYYAALKRLAETSYSPEQLSTTLDQVLGSWVPGNVITSMKAFATNRTAWVLSQIPTSVSAASSLTVVSGFPQATSPTVTLFGSSDPINTRTILVNGTAASWTAWQARWTNTTVALVPGINRILIQALDASGTEILRTNYDVWYNSGPGTSVSGTIASGTVWTPAAGPYTVLANVNVPAGATLTIQPGTTVFINPGAAFVVNGTLIAQGTDTAHIRFTRVPGPGNWGSLDFLNTGTAESRLSYVDIDGCAGTSIGGHAAEVHVNNSRVFIDHCTWANTPAQQYISFDASSFIVQNSIFPTYPWATTAPEMLHGVNGIPAGGYGIFRDNYFGHTYGFNDTIDFTGGNRPGPILQIIGNVFDGAGDDHLDLDSTDAWIEGNIFMHAHRDPNRNTAPGGSDDYRDTASAISGGVDVAGQYSEWTIINNLFYDVDHAVMVKGGNRFVFVNNTLVHVAKENGSGLTNDIAAFDFTDDGIPLPDSAVGAGAYIANNIIWDTPQLTANYAAPNYTVVFENNLLPLAWSGPGGSNVLADPLLNLEVITTVSNADWKTVRSALTPRTGSPALNTGWGAKYDKGGLNPTGLMIVGEPYPATSATSATLRILPGGTFNWGANSYLWGYTHYKWKLDNGAWSAELPITSSPSISLSGLSSGPHTVYVSGRNDVGYYQDDLFVYPLSARVSAHVTASRTWMVTNAPGRVQINEVLAHNTGGVQFDGKSPDVIELFNPGSAPINLGGIGVTDDPADPYKYVLDSALALAPGGYLLLFADSGKDTNGVHIGFGLNQAGDSVYLFDAPARGGALLDSVVFGFQLANLSIARRTDGSWSLAIPTLGAPNVFYPATDPSRVRINEWLADESFGNDFVELYNPDPAPVDLGGCYITDLPAGYPTRHQFPPLSFIPAAGFRVLIADSDPEQGADHLSFKLSPDRGEIALFSPTMSVIDWVLYGPQSTDISEGRSPDGSDTRLFFNQPTPGAPNPANANCIVTTTGFNVLPMVSTWRYNRNGVDLGTAWRASSYDDSSWSSGSALLGVEDCNCLPYPLNTVFLNYSNTQIPYYFRTSFQVSSNLAGVNLALSYVLDDGAVIYLDGTELIRLGMPSGTITATTLPTSVPNNAVLESSTVYNVNLSAGTHSLAVEVHNAANPTSSDIVWGMAVDVTRSFTNCPQVTVALNEVMADNKSYTNADGTISDWIELYNPSSSSSDLSDMSLTDDPAIPRRWVFPSGVTLAPGSYLVVKCDPGTPASTTVSASMNTGFGFDSGGDKILLFDKLSREGALLDSIAFGLQARDFTIGRVPNGTGAWTLTLPTEGSVNIASAQGNTASVRVNEWMADPKSGDDWFELFNPNAQPVSIGDCYLTDDFLNPTQYRIPKLSYIGTGFKGFVKFTADSTPSKGADHTNFKLSQSGESIGFYASDGVTAIDKITFGAQLKGVSEGRFPDGSTNIIKFAETPTPGEANYLPFTDIVINEALTHSDLPLEDAIELFNPTATPINVGGWYLSDSPGSPRKFRIPDNTIVQAGGFAVFYEYQFNPTPGIGSSFSLSSGDGDEIHLSVADALGNLTGYRVTEDFGPQANGVSFGKFESSIGFDFAAMSNRTFGVDSPATVDQFRTGTGATNTYPRVGPVVINEIHYHPPDIGTNDNTLDEYIELYNFATTNVALYDAAVPTNVWRLRNAVDFDFPPNTVVPARGYILVAGFDPSTNATTTALFRSRYGVPAGVVVVGPLKGKLNNDEDNIELRRPDNPNTNDVPYVLVERVHYHDAAPWPYAADWNTNGNGLSLQRVIPQSFANDPVNWRAGLPTAGTTNGPAAGAVPVLSLQPSNRVVTLGSSATMVVSAVGGAFPMTVQWRLNGNDIFGATNGSYTIPSVQYSNVGRYSARVMNAYGVALTTNGILSLAAAPEIVIQPQSRSALVGDTVTFTVAARGSQPLTYQWRKEGTNLPNATATSLILPNVQPANEGAYTVVVGNSFGSVTSVVALLSFNTPPRITAQPQSTNIVFGQTLTLGVTALGSPPLFYQWRFNGANLGSGTASTLTVNNIQPSQGGSYSVVVSNAFGTAISSNALVNVIVPPIVTIVASDASASETAPDTGRFIIRRVGGTNFAMTVGYTIGGTAQNGVDYQSIGSSVVIPIGVTQAVVNILPIDDAAAEAAETVVLSLNTAPEYILGNPSSATVTIADNDNLPPTVSLTAPASNAAFIAAPTNILLTATASDPDGGIAIVEFFWNATNKIGEVAGPGPYNYTWVNAAPGSNVLTAVATDIYGLSRTSASVPVFINGAPGVTITAPPNGTTVGQGAIVLAADAVDTNGSVTRVDFYLGGSLFGRVTNAPYSLLFTNAALTNYQVYAVAFDNYGLASTSSVSSFTVVPNVSFSDMFVFRGNVFGATNFSIGTNTAATAEPGEQPVASGTVPSKSVWISWTAPFAGVVTIDTFGSTFDTVLGVYTNRPGVTPAVSNIVLVAQNDDWTPLGLIQSRVGFTNAAAGTVYHITVDGFGGVSGAVQLHISMSNTPPYILAQPVNQTNNVGSNVTFSVSAAGLSPLQYAWRFNGDPVPSATGASFTLANVQPANAGAYDVLVSNSLGSVTSLVATLVVRTAPVITVQPVDQYAPPGGSATFSVGATGGSLTYQWRFNNANIPGANTTQYTRFNVSSADVGNYTVVVTNFVGSVTSSPAALFLTAAPTLISPRMSNNVFSAVLSGGAPGSGYYIEVTTNLDAWTVLQVVTNVTGQVSFSNTNPAPRRMYRARLMQ